MTGKLSDEQYALMSASYENEQKALEEAAEQLRAELEADEDKADNILRFVERAKAYTEIKKLTPAVAHEFIDYIMVSAKQVVNGKTVYPIDIYYNGVGILEVPPAEEFEEMFQERRKRKYSKEQKTA